MKFPITGILAVVALAQASPLAAQDDGLNQLGQAVQAAANDTPLQVSAGNSIQNTCVDIGNERPNGTPTGDVAEDNLSLRCTEMVSTAFGLLDSRTAPNTLGYNNEQLAEAMQQLSGEEQVSKSRLATESSNGQFANIGMRLDAIRAGARATAGGLSVAMNGMPVSGGNAGDEGGGWGWFLNGALGTGDRDATQREDEYEYDSYGATLGFDYMYDSGFVAGIALGYSDYDVDFQSTKSFDPANITSTQSGGGFEADGYALSLYGIGDIGPISVDGLVSYGQSDYDNERVIRYQSGAGATSPVVVNRTLTGSTESESLTIGLNAGKVFDLGGIDLALSGGISYLDLTVDGYTEKDKLDAMNPDPSGLALRYEDQDVESLQSAVGAQISRVFSTQAGVVLPYAKVEWRHEFENDSDAVRTRYAAYNSEGADRADNSDLIVITDDADEDYFEVGIGVSAVFAQNFQAFIDYTTTVDLEDVSADLITIGIRGSF